MKFTANVDESKMLAAVKSMLWRWVEYHEGAADIPHKFENVFIRDWYRDQHEKQC